MIQASSESLSRRLQLRVLLEKSSQSPVHSPGECISKSLGNVLLGVCQTPAHDDICKKKQLNQNFMRGLKAHPDTVSNKTK